ncbi:MAG TPA: DoxX family membrane protein [Micromonosporaceae bacterium]|nr:DoxX family membrane protein [Micromonosporaceae bacterium]
MTPVRTSARAMLGAVFVASGWKAVKDPSKLAPRAKRVTDQFGPTLQMVHPKIPTDAETLVRLNGAVHVVGGIALVTPARRLAAAVLATSLVPTTLAGHAYWEFEDPADRAQQRIHFLKNLGLLGGLILAAVDTEGKPGLQWRAQHAADMAERSVRRAARNTRSKAAIARKSAIVGRHLPG